MQACENNLLKATYLYMYMRHSIYVCKHRNIKFFKIKLNKYSQPSLQRPDLFPIILPL
jgi:hypothetical protein